MQHFTFLVFCLLLAGTAFGQEADFFVERHGGYATDIRYNGTGAVGLDNGNFLFFYDATNPATGFNNLQLDVISSDGEVVESEQISTGSDQFSGSITKANDGTIWMVAQVNRYDEEDNFADVRLIEYGPDGIVNDYFYDEYRYEGSNNAIVQSAPDRVSFLSEVSDDHLGQRVLHLITVNTANGEVTTDVALPSLSNNYSFASITKGQDGEVLVSAARRANNRIATVDVLAGTIDADDITVSDNGCGSFLGGLYTINYIYDAENQGYVSVNPCLDVYTIQQNGAVEIQDNIDDVEFSVLEPYYVQMESNGIIHVYIDGELFSISPVDDDFEITSQTDIPFSVEGIGSPLVDGNLLVGVSGGVLNVAVYSEATNVQTSVSAYEDLTNVVNLSISRSVGLGNNEILVGEEIDRGREAKILFYSPNGDLLDSIYLDEVAQSSPRGFGVLPDGNYVTSLIRRLESPDRIDVVSFNREDGIVDTLFTVEAPTLFGTLFFQAIQGPNGLFYMSYVGFDEDFNTVRRVVGVDESGSVGFDVSVLSNQNDASLERPGVDALGNVYLFNETDIGSAVQLQRYNAASELDYEIDFIHGYPAEFYISSVYPNEAGTKLLMSATGTTEAGDRETKFYEFDANDGSLLRSELLFAEPGYTLLSQAIYQPGSEDILVLYNDNRGNDAIVGERVSVTFSIYGQDGLFYEQELLTSFNAYQLYDLVVNDNFEIYTVGSYADNTSPSLQSFLIGTDYDAVVSVEEVNDLAETANLFVFPNPTADLATINWDQANAGSYQLEVVTSEGRVINRWLGETTPGRASVNVDLSRRPAGAYLLRLTTDDGVSTQRVVRQ